MLSRGCVITEPSRRLRLSRDGRPELAGPTSRQTACSVDCSIVIVNYRHDEVLLECLGSLSATLAGGPLTSETVVVDNSATLDPAALAGRFPGVQLVRNPVNVGFARACNQGLARARGRHLLLLNPDTVVHEGAVAALCAHLDAHPRVGAAGARLLDPDGRLQYSCRRFPGYFTIFFGRYAVMSRLFPGNTATRDYLYLDWDHDAVREVDWVSGACLMVRREVLEQVGPLDPAYFLFVEDMDWCRRIRDAGWTVDYVPAARVTHRIGVSRGPVPPRLVWARHRGMWRYVRTHMRPAWPLAAVIGTALTVRGAALALAGLGRRRRPGASPAAPLAPLRGEGGHVPR
jgi:N-acetylglucosaminyl-diphospho-decaprenol L-rhamnosyltransferase